MRYPSLRDSPTATLCNRYHSVRHRTLSKQQNRAPKRLLYAVGSLSQISQFGYFSIYAEDNLIRGD